MPTQVYNGTEIAGRPGIYREVSKHNTEGYFLIITKTKAFHADENSVGDAVPEWFQKDVYFEKVLDLGY